MRLLALPIEIRAFLAKRLPASALTQILPLNVVARIAVRVVVMNGLFDGVPRRLLRHCWFPFLRSKLAAMENPTAYTQARSLGLAKS